MTRKQVMKTVRRVVVKVGTNQVTSDGHIDRGKISRIVDGLLALRAMEKQVVVVTSGAVGGGAEVIRGGKPGTIPEKQAASAVGQALLMQHYIELFGRYNVRVGQMLLTSEISRSRRLFLNARNTINTLLRFDCVPVVNENDSIAVEELRVGDNDTLSAIVADLAAADLLVLLSDVDGFYSNYRNESERTLLRQIERITPEIEEQAQGSGGGFSTGGMETKIRAAKACFGCSIPMVIADGGHPEVLPKILAGEEVGTIFLPPGRTISLRKRWIGYSSSPAGTLVVDEGARNAFAAQGRSLLAAGILKVEGEFVAGDTVDILNEMGKRIARGITNYSAVEIVGIRGKKSGEIPKILGYEGYDEVVHRDNMVLTEED